MGQIYQRLGVRTGINAAGTLTRLGGTRMEAEVLAAMAEAARSHVRLDQLHAAVGRRLAEVTGSEAALVTSGAAAAMTLAAAACIARDDAGRMDRLPETSGLPCEIVVARSQRNGYDHALRAAGARLIEVGLAERTRDPQPWEIEAAIGPETVALAYFVGFSALALQDVVAVGRRHGLPVIVDASASLPPRANLRRFIAAGSDLVAYSGGKGLRGPQASGILCGKRALVASAALQMWDLDVLPELWDPPAELIDASWPARGVPNHGLGRGMKVGREEIVGLWVAVERFLALDEAAELARLSRLAEWMAAELRGLQGVHVELVPRVERWPVVVLCIDAARAGRTATELVRALEAGDPAVFVGQGECRAGRVGIDPFGLSDDEAACVVAQVRRLWGGSPEIQRVSRS